MNQTIQPLKQQFKINEDAGFVQDQILERVRSESNFDWSREFPLIKSENVKGRAGEPSKQE